jgi:SAM-dependent methyltransferase
MKNYSLKKRCALYAKAFPQYPDSHLHMGQDDTRFYGMWFGGQNYKSKVKFYGTYPAGYLKRVEAFFPDAEVVLHLFAGAVEPGDYTRFDLHPDRGDVHGDAEKLSDHFDEESFDVIYADPPYSQADQEKYIPGQKMVNRKKVLHECAKVLKPGGFVVWLDQVMPMFTKREFSLAGSVGFVRSTNHRFRVITFFRKHK